MKPKEIQCFKCPVVFICENQEKNTINCPLLQLLKEKNSLREPDYESSMDYMRFYAGRE